MASKDITNESSSDGTNSYTDSSAETQIEKIRVENYGIGLVLGKKSSTFRLEFSQSINHGIVPWLKNGKRNILSIEGYTKGLYGRFSTSQTSGDFMNFNNIMSALTSDRVNSNKVTNSYTGSAGLKSKKGHQIGASISYSKVNAPVRIACTNFNQFQL